MAGFAESIETWLQQLEGMVDGFEHQWEGTAARFRLGGGAWGDWVDIRGKSACEVAVEEGFVGSRAGWLASLKGDKGDEGPPGTSVTIQGELGDADDLPVPGAPGDAYVINSDLWVWVANDEKWENVGQIKGDRGEDGATIHAVVDAPETELGNPDDIAFRANGDVYKKGEEGWELLFNATGPQGKNAYELAVDEGYEGTLEEWLGGSIRSECSCCVRC